MQEGQLERWDDARGFGFIRVGPGRPDVFVHISAFEGGVRPRAGDRILFDAAQNGQKGPRAARALVKGGNATVAGAGPAPGGVRGAGGPPEPTRQRPRLHALSGSPQTLLVLVLAGFCLLGALSFLPRSPVPLLLYPVLSSAAFVLYGADKYRAARGHWRIREGTLHLVEALGGWPGAFLAQQVLRHKTAKRPYQVTFWLIVAAHVGFWALWLLRPKGL